MADVMPNMMLDHGSAFSPFIYLPSASNVYLIDSAVLFL